MAKIKNKYKVCYQNSTKTWNNPENMFLFSNTKLSNKFNSKKWKSFSRNKNFNTNDLQKKWRKRRFIFAHNCTCHMHGHLIHMGDIDCRRYDRAWSPHRM